MMLHAQAIGLPFPHRDGGGEGRGRGRTPALRDGGGGGHGDERLGIFPLPLPARVLAPASQEELQLLIGHRAQDLEPPTHERGRKPQRGDRVAGVVLAVAVGPLPVFPSLAPGDRRQRGQEGPLRQALGQGRARLGGIGRAALQGVPARVVVVEPGPDARAARRQDEVGFGRMQVPAGGVHAQGPAAAAQLLPRGEGHGEVEELGERSRVHGARRYAPGQVEHGEGRGGISFGDRKLEGLRALEYSERVGLIVPVQMPEGLGEAVVAVLGPLVVVEDGREGAGALLHKCSDKSTADGRNRTGDLPLTRRLLYR